MITAVVLGLGGLASALPASASTAPHGQHQAVTQAGVASATGPDFTGTLVGDLRARGFQVNPGYAFMVGPQACKDYSYPLLKHCMGNNPAGGYAIAAVKAWPDEQVGPTPANVLGPVQPGYTPFYRLALRDAIVMYGKMPPPGRYLSWSTVDWSEHGKWKAKDYDDVASIANRPFPMQYQFHTIPPNDPHGGRVWSWSALADSINDAVMRRQSGDPWGKNRYIIATPSKATDKAVRSALHAQGVPDGDIFTEQIPSRDAYGPIGPLGRGKNAIEFFSTIRYTLPDDPSAAREWWSTLPLTVMRVSAPSSLGPVQRFGALTFTAPQGHSEAYLADDLEDLTNAVCNRVTSRLSLQTADCTRPPTASSFMVSTRADYGWTGPYCRETGLWCGGTNPDVADYEMNPLPLDSGQVYAVVDTLATETGNATFVGLSVNDASTFYGPTGASDATLKGSANGYTGVTNTDKFFVHYLTRDCAALESVLDRAQDCTSITEGMLPPKAATTALGDPTLHGMFMPILRNYIVPGTTVGPDYANLLRPRVLTFTQP
jgi:hypothetical protein